MVVCVLSNGAFIQTGRIFGLLLKATEVHKTKISCQWQRGQLFIMCTSPMTWPLIYSKSRTKVQSRCMKNGTYSSLLGRIHTHLHRYGRQSMMHRVHAEVNLILILHMTWTLKGLLCKIKWSSKK